MILCTLGVQVHHSHCLYAHLAPYYVGFRQDLAPEPRQDGMEVGCPINEFCNLQSDFSKRYELTRSLQQRLRMDHASAYWKGLP